METPKSPPPQDPPPPTTDPPSPSAAAAAATTTAPATATTHDPIPLTSPLRTHSKRLLPATLASTYPHGHLSGHPRPAPAQTALLARRDEILRSLSTKEIEKRYEEVAGEVRREMERAERGREEVEREREKRGMEREIERRVWGKIRGLGKGGGG